MDWRCPLPALDLRLADHFHLICLKFTNLCEEKNIV
jgi:hypothetical protein